MTVVAVVGAQWGDEGKGKIIDFLSEQAQCVARYQGGPNAGHTVVTGDEQFVLHSIPSGIVHPGKRCLVGHGVVIDPQALLAEIEHLESREIRVEGRLTISPGAHLIIPYHRLLDQASEKHLGGGKLGTTGRGIGPAYTDKAARVGVRLGDLLAPDRLREKVRMNLQEKNLLLRELYGQTELSLEEILQEYCVYRDRLAPFIEDTTLLLWEAIDRGDHILVEGAQGTMLDVDLGTYPFVTSSNAAIGGACTGLGIPPKVITTVIGVVKAYATRVGEGPFPTELTGKEGDVLRERGMEYGATTGRPRRCGWFDAVVARYAVRVNGLRFLAVTKLDVLDEAAQISVCVGYRWQGKEYREITSEIPSLADCEPVYVERRGWRESTLGVTSYEALPIEARNYVEFISSEVGVPVGIISTGPRRDQTIVLQNAFSPPP
ncbi:MAG: adenylosuccinate synthase [Candidatus Tectomicrobia bacterium]|uniref:Adenylosuccinate synthetase n=1 Tax=Tectimicrobiota bacterium TaxID=2528274 RepID=A0A932GLW5_UNCTE|nr:adenylosuccinate synthase [Candidatus Tectomicrobia bacterium]